jgi:hypothetical protein
LNLISSKETITLSENIEFVVDAILKGQYNLCRLLYQICECNIECIYPLTKHLIKMMQIVDNKCDTQYLLKIIYLISLNHVQVCLQPLKLYRFYIIHIQIVSRILNNFMS